MPISSINFIVIKGLPTKKTGLVRLFNFPVLLNSALYKCFGSMVK